MSHDDGFQVCKENVENISQSRVTFVLQKKRKTSKNVFAVETVRSLTVPSCIAILTALMTFKDAEKASHFIEDDEQ